MHYNTFSSFDVYISYVFLHALFTIFTKHIFHKATFARAENL
jgi:hypothetical protein